MVFSKYGVNKLVNNNHGITIELHVTLLSLN